jgi:hypothetical protein
MFKFEKPNQPTQNSAPEKSKNQSFGFLFLKLERREPAIIIIVVVVVVVKCDLLSKIFPERMK